MLRGSGRRRCRRCRCRIIRRCGHILTAVKDLLAKYDTLEFNPKKGDALLTGKGFKKNCDGIWARDGQPVTLDIIGFGASGAAYGAGAVGDVEAARHRGVIEPAAGFRRPVPEGRVYRLDLRARRLDQRAVRDAAAVPGAQHRGARRRIW